MRGENGFDFQQFLSQRQQWRVEVHVGDAVGGFQFGKQVLDGLGGDGQVEHVQGVAELAQRGLAAFALLRVDAAGAQFHVQRVFHLRQFLAHRLADRGEQLRVAAGDGAAGAQQGVAVRDQLFEAKALAQRVGGLAAGTRLGGVEQQGAGQRRDGVGGRPFLATVDHRFQRQVETGEQPPQRQVVIDGPLAQALHRAFGDPPQAPEFVSNQADVQRAADLLHGPDQGVFGLFFQPAEQGGLVLAADVGCEGREVAGGDVVGLAAAEFGHDHVELGCEQAALGQQRLVVGRTQLVQGRQQQDRHVLMAGLQAVEV